MKYKIEVYQNGRFIGANEFWDKQTANRAYKKQQNKMDTTVIMYDPTGKKIRG